MNLQKLYGAGLILRKFCVAAQVSADDNVAFALHLSCRKADGPHCRDDADIEALALPIS
jgi:hypothetical protein